MTLQDSFANVDCGICGAPLGYTGGKKGWMAAGSAEFDCKPHKHSPVPKGTPPNPGDFKIKEKNLNR